MVYPVLGIDDGGDHQDYTRSQSPQTPNTPKTSGEQDMEAHHGTFTQNHTTNNPQFIVSSQAIPNIQSSTISSQVVSIFMTVQQN